MKCEKCGHSVGEAVNDKWFMYQFDGKKVINKLFDPDKIPKGWFDSPKAAKAAFKAPKPKKATNEGLAV